MRFECLEPRHLLASDLIGSQSAILGPDTFYYSSDVLSQQAILGINDGDFQFAETNGWHLPIYNNQLRTSDDGYLVAERLQSDFNSHTLFTAVVKGSSNFGTDGTYTLPDSQYQISFDVRFPESEAPWLFNHEWAIVMQLWGPRELDEVTRNPPLSIYTGVSDGEPVWRIATRADSRRISVDRDYQDEFVATAPFGRVGEWQHWDVEYVVDPFGNGLVRAWLDGAFVADLTNIQTGYYSHVASEPSGPLNPSFGLAPLVGDQMEAHFDNIHIVGNGRFDRSIAGKIESANPGQSVVAVNSSTKQQYETTASSAGVYMLNVPAGHYSLTATDDGTGKTKTVQVDASEESRVADVLITKQPVVVRTPFPKPKPVAPPKPEPQVKTPRIESPVTDETNVLLGDFNGDGATDAIHYHMSGAWFLGSVDDNRQLVTTSWAQIDQSQYWTNVLVADFSGDGSTDIATLNDRGEWWVAHSNGGEVVNEWWGQWDSSSKWHDIQTGDFNGDGKTDITGRASDSSWWVAQSNGHEFVSSQWDAWDRNVEWVNISVGDFNGDGLDDIAGHNLAGGWWWVSESMGDSFRLGPWGQWPIDTVWEDVLVADVNGDGRSDLLGRSNYNIWNAAESTGDSFELKMWSVWDSAEDWLDATVMDLNGDGMDDVVARAASTDQMWATISSGLFGRRRRSRNVEWGPVWASDTNWLDVKLADFDGDGEADILTLGIEDSRRRRIQASYSIEFG